VVENFFPTGYGFPSYTLLGSTVIRLPFIVATSLGHEVAHSWFGNGVLVDYRFGNWSEDLTTYLADHLYRELSSPEEGREYRLQILRDYAALVPPEKDFTRRVSPSSRAVGCGKGAMVFHMARRMVGNDAFWNGLREVFREKLFDGATWNDFAIVLGRSGKRDLDHFFRQWVSRSGAPTLLLNGVGAVKDDRGWEITGRLVQQRLPYDLQVPLRLETDGKDVEAKIRLSGQEASFALRSEAPPRRLVGDPEVNLFRRLDPAEIPEQIQRRSTIPYRVILPEEPGRSERGDISPEDADYLWLQP
jgi:aminopeptidase N